MKLFVHHSNKMCQKLNHPLYEPMIYSYCVIGYCLQLSSNLYSYSVMQSDGNSFCGIVVSDGLNNDEDNILYQISSEYYHDDLNSLYHQTKIQTKKHNRSTKT